MLQISLLLGLKRAAHFTFTHLLKLLKLDLTNGFGKFAIVISITLSSTMLENGQTYFKNLAVWETQNFYVIASTYKKTKYVKLYEKWTFLTSWYAHLPRAKKYSFFEKFDVLCFLVTSAHLFALLPTLCLTIF